MCVQSIHSFFSLFAWLGCRAQDRSLSLLSERPRSPNPCVAFTAGQIPVWRCRSGFKNPFCTIGGLGTPAKSNTWLRGSCGNFSFFFKFLLLFCTVQFDASRIQLSRQNTHKGCNLTCEKYSQNCGAFVIHKNCIYMFILFCIYVSLELWCVLVIAFYILA